MPEGEMQRNSAARAVAKDICLFNASCERAAATSSAMHFYN
jgi:hypothetical protein